MNAIIISDLHIGSRFCAIEALEHFLSTVPDTHELILNGDIIDNPYAKLSRPHQRILDLLEQISHRQKVTWIPGNHDNGYIPSGLGKVQFRRQHTLEHRLLITHGDDFDEIMPRSRLFMKLFKLMHRLRVYLGAQPVHVAEYAKKWKYLYKVLRKNVLINAVNCAIENGFEAVTCGHTHYAEDQVFNGIRYINTGAWTELPAFYIEATAESMILMRMDQNFEHQKTNSSHRAISSAHPSSLKN